MLESDFFFLQADLLDAAAGVHVRFRFGGVSIDEFLCGNFKAHS